MTKFTLYEWHNDPKPEEKIEVPCEVYSRIVGYVRPVRNWNVGKKQEFSERQVYNLPVLHSPPTYDKTPLEVEIEVTECS